MFFFLFVFCYDRKVAPDYKSRAALCAGFESISKRLAVCVCRSLGLSGNASLAYAPFSFVRALVLSLRFRLARMAIITPVYVRTYIYICTYTRAAAARTRSRDDYYPRLFFGPFFSPAGKRPHNGANSHRRFVSRYRRRSNLAAADSCAAGICRVISLHRTNAPSRRPLLRASRARQPRRSSAGGSTRGSKPESRRGAASALSPGADAIRYRYFLRDAPALRFAAVQ